MANREGFNHFPDEVAQFDGSGEGFGVGAELTAQTEKAKPAVTDIFVAKSGTPTELLSNSQPVRGLQDTTELPFSLTE